MHKRVLITGGAGFIGCEISRKLLTLGHDVCVADNLHQQVHPVAQRPAVLDSSVRFSPFDVAEPGAWRSLLAVEAPEVIIHLAAETGTGQSLRQGSRHASVNVVGTTRMTDALFEIGHVPEHVLLTSSRAVYGEGMYSNAHGAMFYPKPRSRARL